MTDHAGLYIHIPFCRSRCQYCGFYSETRCCTDAYVKAAVREMELRSTDGAPYLFDTVYFGGGTPSCLSPGQTEELLSEARKWFPVSDHAEITMEMNPCDMSDPWLRNIYGLGVNRISVGVQSQRDDLLIRIGRRHTAAEARSAVRRAFRTGFHNISIDLMYDLPGQTPRDFRKALQTAAHLPITHISVYSLILEEGTPFWRQRERGHLRLPPEEESWVMYQDMCRIPAQYGFRRYEISSFARPGYESAHNQKYWRMDPYIGIGPSAHSNVGDLRWGNSPDLAAYMKTLSDGALPPHEKRVLTEKSRMEEYCFLHLRMTEGIGAEDFQNSFGHPLAYWYGNTISRLESENLIRRDSGRVFLTYKGMALGNLVFEQFLQD